MHMVDNVGMSFLKLIFRSLACVFSDIEFSQSPSATIATNKQHRWKGEEGRILCKSSIHPPM